MIIRVLLLSALAAIGYMVFLRRSRFPVHILIVFLMLAVAATAVIFPEKTDLIAEVFGVGRGVDLITYLVLVSLLYTVTHYYTKFVDVDQQLTQLVREIAILRAEVRLAKGESLAALPAEVGPSASSESPTTTRDPGAEAQPR